MLFNWDLTLRLYSISSSERSSSLHSVKSFLWSTCVETQRDYTFGNKLRKNTVASFIWRFSSGRSIRKLKSNHLIKHLLNSPCDWIQRFILVCSLLALFFLSLSIQFVSYSRNDYTITHCWKIMSSRLERCFFKMWSHFLFDNRFGNVIEIKSLNLAILAISGLTITIIAHNEHWHTFHDAITAAK